MIDFLKDRIDLILAIIALIGIIIAWFKKIKSYIIRFIEFLKILIIKKSQLKEFEKYIDVYLSPNPVKLNIYQYDELVLGLIIENNSVMDVMVESINANIFIIGYFNVYEELNAIIKSKNNKETCISNKDLSDYEKESLRNYIKNDRVIEARSMNITLKFNYDGKIYTKEYNLKFRIEITGNYLTQPEIINNLFNR